MNSVPIRCPSVKYFAPTKKKRIKYFMSSVVGLLPAGPANMIMEFVLYKHALPYKWIRAFNRCIAQLPRPARMTHFGKTCIRYRTYDTSCPYRKRRKRFIWTDHVIQFKNHPIYLEETTYDYVEHVRGHVQDHAKKSISQEKSDGYK